MSAYIRGISSRHSTMSMGSDGTGAPPTVLRNDCVLYLTVLAAHGLKKTQKIGVQDPFCAVYLVSHGKVSAEPAFKTATHDNGGAFYLLQC